jgi:hypothetical protein
MKQVYVEREPLPPRRKVYPSYRGRWTRRFYGALVLLFCSLIVAIIVWFQMHPV